MTNVFELKVKQGDFIKITLRESCWLGKCNEVIYCKVLERNRARVIVKRCSAVDEQQFNMLKVSDKWVTTYHNNWCFNRFKVEKAKKSDVVLEGI